MVTQPFELFCLKSGLFGCSSQIFFFLFFLSVGDLITASFHFEGLMARQVLFGRILWKKMLIFLLLTLKEKIQKDICIHVTISILIPRLRAYCFAELQPPRRTVAAKDNEAGICAFSRKPQAICFVQGRHTGCGYLRSHLKAADEQTATS